MFVFKELTGCRALGVPRDGPIPILALLTIFSVGSLEHLGWLLCTAPETLEAKPRRYKSKQAQPHSGTAGADGFALLASIQ